MCDIGSHSNPSAVALRLGFVSIKSTSRLWLLTVSLSCPLHPGPLVVQYTKIQLELSLFSEWPLTSYTHYAWRHHWQKYSSYHSCSKRWCAGLSLVFHTHALWGKPLGPNAMIPPVQWGEDWQQRVSFLGRPHSAHEHQWDKCPAKLVSANSCVPRICTGVGDSVIGTRSSYDMIFASQSLCRSSSLSKAAFFCSSSGVLGFLVDGSVSEEFSRTNDATAGFPASAMLRFAAMWKWRAMPERTRLAIVKEIPKKYSWSPQRSRDKGLGWLWRASMQPFLAQYNERDVGPIFDTSLGHGASAF